jgi:hypothetical protein
VPVTHTCNPIFLATWEAEIQRITVTGQPGQKSLRDPHLNGKSWAWWCASVIPLMLGSKSWSRPAWAKTRPYFQNNQNKKSTCLASVKLWIQTPVLPRKTKKPKKKTKTKQKGFLWSILVEKKSSCQNYSEMWVNIFILYYTVLYCTIPYYTYYFKCADELGRNSMFPELKGEH